VEKTHRPRVLIVSRHDPLAPRPQPLQTLWAADGLAAAGARVTLLMDAPAPRDRAMIEAHLGRSLHPRLALHFAEGAHPGVRGVRRRWATVRLIAAGADAVLSRDMRVTAQLASLGRLVPPRIHEWHSLPTALGQGDEGEAAAARGADAHLFVSPGLRDRIVDGFEIRGPVLVAGNGCLLDPAAAQRALTGLETAHRVLGASLLRGPADDALAEQLDGLPATLELVRLGPGTPRGLLSPAEVAATLPGCLCQLALYRDDRNTREFASPLKVAGALSTGVPLVASDLPTVRALVAHGETALLVPAGDARALTEAIHRLDRDRALARRLAGAALEQAPRHSWRRRGERLLALVEAL
jgi:hypothetical protein